MLTTPGELPTPAPGRSPSRAADFQVSLTLQAQPAAVAQARRLVHNHTQTHGLDNHARDTAVLLTSELVTNAVVHGHGRVCLTVHASPTRLLVEVTDDNPRPPLVPQPHTEPDPETLNGRGLLLLCALADGCGTYPSGLGKVVWFSLDRTTPPPA